MCSTEESIYIYFCFMNYAFKAPRDLGRLLMLLKNVRNECEEKVCLRSIRFKLKQEFLFYP